MMNEGFSEKAKVCKNIEEIREPEEKEKIELTDEELRELAAGVFL